MDNQIDKLYQCFSLIKYKKGEVIYDNLNRKIVVIIEGSLIKVSNYLFRTKPMKL
jgi:hypothetical protein